VVTQQSEAGFASQGCYISAVGHYKSLRLWEVYKNAVATKEILFNISCSKLIHVINRFMVFLLLSVMILDILRNIMMFYTLYVQSMFSLVYR
jgi:hypothetical protein